MNLEANFFQITFFVLIIILTVYFPISGHKAVRKLKQSLADGDRHQKIKFYRETLLWLWVPALIVFLVIPVSGIAPSDIGLKWIDIDESLSKWIRYPVIGFYILYLIYCLYSIVLYKYSKKGRAKMAVRIPDGSRWLLPVSKKEKSTWSALSLSAGITEELIYRGYLFYALAVIFPALSIVHILFISTVIFGIVHIYLKEEAVKASLLGLLFGIFYIVFDSIIPVMIIHTAQDLMLRDILEEESEQH